MEDKPKENNIVPAEISRVTVKPPPFWKTNPTLWFIQLESQFALANITADETKFHYVVSAMDSDMLNSVCNLLISPPKNEAYNSLKAKLIELHSESEASKIRTLLQGLELGDQRPSQLLSRMRALAGDSVGEPLLKSLWTSRMPTTTQTILAALNEDLSGLATVADKIHELPTTINAVSSKTPDESKIDRLEQQVAHLTSLVTSLTTQRHSRHRSRTPNRKKNKNRDQSHTYREASDGLCFYHTNFGIDARNCKKPCSFPASGN